MDKEKNTMRNPESCSRKALMRKQAMSVQIDIPKEVDGATVLDLPSETLAEEKGIKPTCARKITEFLRKGSRSYTAYTKLLVGGKDEWSHRSLDDLQYSLGKEAIDQVRRYFEDEKEVLTALRWHGRGLPLSDSIRKVLVDRKEVGEHKIVERKEAKKASSTAEETVKSDEDGIVKAEIAEIMDSVGTYLETRKAKALFKEALKSNAYYRDLMLNLPAMEEKAVYEFADEGLLSDYTMHKVRSARANALSETDQVFHGKLRLCVPRDGCAQFFAEVEPEYSYMRE